MNFLLRSVIALLKLRAELLGIKVNGKLQGIKHKRLFLEITIFAR